MVDLNIDKDTYEFTTKDVLNNFTIEEKIITVESSKLHFGFLGEDPYLRVEDTKYYFDSKVSMISFLQKLSITTPIIASLTLPTLVLVVNERLKTYSSNLNLIIDKTTGKILSTTTLSAKLVNWKRILTVVHEVFSNLEDKTLYLTTFAGLGISIKMNNDDANMDILRIEPQTYSSISLYHGVATETVPLRGYDEAEILELFKEKLQLMIDVEPGFSKNYSLVRE